MYSFIQQPANRSITVSVEGFYVVIRIAVQEAIFRGSVTIRLSIKQARELAGVRRKMLHLESAAPAPKGPYTELWYTPLPDGSSHVAISYSATPHEADATWLAMLLSAEDYPDWHTALMMSADRADG